MYRTTTLLSAFHSFAAGEITDRFFKHTDLIQFLENLRDKPLFSVREVGKSFEGRPINLISCGSGATSVFLWSQMHGNEATATMALMDLFNFLGDTEASQDHHTLKDLILHNCTLHILPMVNPDGAEVFNRRNAQELDINRDFNSQQTPEGRLLRRLRDEIKPDFGFNLHDQTTLWSAGSLGNPATISLLAPAYDDALSINSTRHAAMQVIAEINDSLQEIIPGHVGRFNDEYEPRAFGDNFQAAGTSTILIEAGGFADDPEKQHIRKLVFLAVTDSLRSISERTYFSRSLDQYFAIPENKLHHFHIVLRNCRVSSEGRTVSVQSPHFNAESPQIKAHGPIPFVTVSDPYLIDVGIIAQESLSENLRSMNYNHVVGDLGDLSNRFGYKDIDCSAYTLIQTKKLKFEENADIVLMDGTEVLLSIENGVMSSCTI